MTVSAISLINSACRLEGSRYTGASVENPKYSLRWHSYTCMYMHASQNLSCFSFLYAGGWDKDRGREKDKINIRQVIEGGEIK